VSVGGESTGAGDAGPDARAATAPVYQCPDCQNQTNPALILNRRGGRLSPRGAHDVLLAIADQAGIGDDFTGHVLRHTFGTTLVRGGYDLVLVAELMGHARVETTRSYSLPTADDRERAINSLPTDH